MTATRQWTLMVYMAGDTGIVFKGPVTGEALFANLSGPLAEDLRKMQAAGSSEQVAVCVQYDSLDAGKAFRWIVPAVGDSTPTYPQPIGAVNTGDPDSLSDFVRWAGQQRPAEHYALVIWGHGNGWDETQLYERFPEAQKVEESSRAVRRGELVRRGVFASTAAQIMEIPDDEVRGLCYDDSARDFLDNAELQRALRDAAQHLGRDKIDVLGLDACLMAMIEVAYQIRNEASYLVGAETVLPTDLWPWTEILQALHDRPETTPRELAVSLAGNSLQGANGSRGIDDMAQSALDLSLAETTVQALNAWTRVLIEGFDADYRVKDAVRRARGKGHNTVLRLGLNGLDETDYVDLFDLVRRFVHEYFYERDVDAFLAGCEADGDQAPDEDAHLRLLTCRLLKALLPEGVASLVLKINVEGFYRRAQPGGLSIYLPPLDDRYRLIDEISPQYGNLEFADGSWPELICKQFDQDLPQAFLDLREKRRAAPTRD